MTGVVGDRAPGFGFGNGNDGGQLYTELALVVVRRAYNELGGPAGVRSVLAEEGLLSRRRKAGKRVPYSDGTIWNWMRGDSLPDIEVFLALARRTNQSLDELLGLRAAQERERQELLDRLRDVGQQVQDYVERSSGPSPGSGGRRRPGRTPRPGPGSGEGGGPGAG